MRDVGELALPKGAAGVKDSERKMASQLIDDMTANWEPALYTDHFAEAINELVANRVKTGKTAIVEPIETEAGTASSNVIDLTELLRNSLKARDKSPKKEADQTSATAKAPAAKQKAPVSALRAPAKKTTKRG